MGSLPTPSRHQSSTARLLLLAFMPSAISAVGCFVAAIFIIVLHVIFVSLNVGTVLPSLFDGQWAISYTNVVVQPLQKVFQNNHVNQILTVVMWSIVGLLVYEASEYFRKNYHGLREAEHDVQMAGDHLVRHPALRSFVVRFVWRLGLGVMLIVGLIWLNPLFKRLFMDDYNLFNGSAQVGSAFRTLTLNVFIWAILAHVVVVFVRLYSMRPRLGRS